MRTFDVDKIKEAVELYAKDILGFYPDEWLANEENVALTNDNGDIFLFERELPGVVTAHYFFYSRGRKAVNAGKEMLKELFTGPYDVQLIRGLTPLEHLGARWMNKQLGATSYGVVHTILGPCELVILTKQEWENS